MPADGQTTDSAASSLYGQKAEIGAPGKIALKPGNLLEGNLVQRNSECGHSDWGFRIAGNIAERAGGREVLLLCESSEIFRTGVNPRTWVDIKRAILAMGGIDGNWNLATNSEEFSGTGGLERLTRLFNFSVDFWRMDLAPKDREQVLDKMGEFLAQVCSGSGKRGRWNKGKSLEGGWTLDVFNYFWPLRDLMEEDPQEETEAKVEELWSSNNGVSSNEVQMLSSRLCGAVCPKCANLCALWWVGDHIDPEEGIPVKSDGSVMTAGREGRDLAWTSGHPCGGGSGEVIVREGLLAERLAFSGVGGAFGGLEAELPGKNETLDRCTTRSMTRRAMQQKLGMSQSTGKVVTAAGEAGSAELIADRTLTRPAGGGGFCRGTGYVCAVGGGDGGGSVV